MDSHLLDFIPPLENHMRMRNPGLDVRNIYLNCAAKGLDKEFNDLFTHDAIQFLVDLVCNFERDVDQLHYNRLQRKSHMDQNLRIPNFEKSNFDDNWRIDPVIGRLKNRHLDLGDVSPSNLEHFIAALRADVQGIQVDVDDGHCPTWHNQIYGLHNVSRAVQNSLTNVPDISEAPLLMMRPRAWNIIEHNMSVNGREVSATLFDFGLLIFHNGQRLHELQCGPYFYLSKMENSQEARLWNNIFTWSEQRLHIPHGTIKACVLIENILSVFEMDQILYEIRDHAVGLNCGIWDYAASIIAKFGRDKSFLLPDRNKFININARFLRKYLQLAVTVCHKRGAYATGGMVADVLSKDGCPDKNKNLITQICHAKISEIKEGIDGFIIYDVRLVPAMNRLWQKYSELRENHGITWKEEIITEKDLLILPQGGVTLQGLKHNISVITLFISNWLSGEGHFVFDDVVEDSATAEISRSQIWQWVQHGAKLEDDGRVITRQMVTHYAKLISNDLIKSRIFNSKTRQNMDLATHLSLHLINCRYFPEFITTFLNDSYPFRKIHARL